MNKCRSYGYQECLNLKDKFMEISSFYRLYKEYSNCSCGFVIVGLIKR